MGDRRRGTVVAGAVVLALLLLGGSAVAYVAEPFRVYSTEPIPGNPAERYADRVIEQPRSYRQEVPKRCVRTRRKGVDRFVAWLRTNAKRGKPGGRYRCENLGRGIGFSFHSDGRALDLVLDSSRAGDWREASRLLKLLLARDSRDEPAALARRMGVMEIIWYCGYWAQGMPDFDRYFLCDGRPLGRGAKSIEHRDHIHFSFTRAGAAARTSFWRPVRSVPLAPAPAPAPEEPASEETPPPAP